MSRTIRIFFSLSLLLLFVRSRYEGEKRRREETQSGMRGEAKMGGIRRECWNFYVYSSHSLFFCIVAELLFYILHFHVPSKSLPLSLSMDLRVFDTKYNKFFYRRFFYTHLHTHTHYIDDIFLGMNKESSIILSSQFSWIKNPLRRCLRG